MNYWMVASCRLFWPPNYYFLHRRPTWFWHLSCQQSPQYDAEEDTNQGEVTHLARSQPQRDSPMWDLGKVTNSTATQQIAIYKHNFSVVSLVNQEEYGRDNPDFWETPMEAEAGGKTLQINFSCREDDSLPQSSRNHSSDVPARRSTSSCNHVRKGSVL